jgi:hypothetical protein
MRLALVCAISAGTICVREDGAIATGCNPISLIMAAFLDLLIVFGGTQPHVE